MNALKLDSLSIEKQEALQVKRLNVVLNHERTEKERVIALDTLRKIDTGEGILAEGEHPDMLLGADHRDSYGLTDCVTPRRMNELMMEVSKICDEHEICSGCGEDLCCSECGACKCVCR